MELRTKHAAASKRKIVVGITGRKIPKTPSATKTMPAAATSSRSAFDFTDREPVFPPVDVLECNCDMDSSMPAAAKGKNAGSNKR